MLVARQSSVIISGALTEVRCFLAGVEITVIFLVLLDVHHPDRHSTTIATKLPIIPAARMKKAPYERCRFKRKENGTAKFSYQAWRWSKVNGSRFGLDEVLLSIFTASISSSTHFLDNPASVSLCMTYSK